MKVILSLCCILFADLLVAQIKHAPTVTQCQADERTWAAQIDEHLQHERALSWTYYTLKDMGEEMLACDDVDPRNHTAYINTAVEITEAMNKRAMSFIARHQLWDQFIEEDAAGKR